MDGNRPAPSRKAWPWGLIGMLVLVLLAECGVAARELDLFGDVAILAWRINGGKAIEPASRADILCFGDSLVQMGMLPPILEAHLGRSAYNLALPRGRAAASEYLLRRVLDAGGRPKALIVDFYLTTLDTPARDVTRYWPELVGPDGAADLAWSGRDPMLFGRVALAAVVPSIRRRDDVRDAVRAALGGGPRPSRNVVVAFLRNREVNRGATPASMRPPAPARFVRSPGRGGWRPTRFNDRHVRRFLDLAASRRIPVYWVIPPLSPGRQAEHGRNGEDEGYSRFVRAIQESYPGVVVLDGRRAGYPADAFADPTHLNRRGAVEFSATIASRIGPLIDGRGPGPRRIVLPTYRGLPDDPRVEDVAQSLAAVAGGRDSARR